jgi:secondary thiamine-phosphate synthase enzyme
MARQSTAAYETDVAGVPVGPRIRGSAMSVETSRRLEHIDITEQIAAFVDRWAIGEGLIVLSSLHSTCALIVNEFQRALTSDIDSFFERIAPRDAPWLHNDPAHSDCERMNADAHLRALMLGSGVMVQVANGALVLGHWQRIILVELDGPRIRHLRIQGWDLSAGL